MTVEPVDLLGDSSAAEAAAREWYAVSRTSWDEAFGERSHPWTLHEIRCWVRGDSSTRYVHLLARDPAGRAAGAAQLAFPLRDNEFQAFVELEVAPDCRRRGIGSALLAETARRVLQEGRTTLVVESQRGFDRGDVATAFAQRHGFTRALVSGRNDLDLPLTASGPNGERTVVDLDAVLASLDVEVAEADPMSDYHLVTYWDRLPTTWLDHRPGLAAKMSTDGPLDDLELEPEVWDAERFLDTQRIIQAQGRRRVETLAVHTETATLVGSSDIVIAPAEPEVAHQWDTIVSDGHRGRRLGMWIKAANLRALLAGFPAVRRVITYNAESNSPMLRVNLAMGFRQVGTDTEWQKRLT